MSHFGRQAWRHDDNNDTLDEIRQWMVERLLKFREVFGPRLDELVK